ncbi:MAG: hypothetical protein KDA63_12045, partial [Planctomycetales bacterium]|nr:hypothetical protein [Planctomycetales bacterium]
MNCSRRFHPRRIYRSHGVLFGAALLGASLLLASARVTMAQSLWELSPYRVKIVLLAPHTGGASHEALAIVQQSLVDGCTATVGATWEVAVETVPFEESHIEAVFATGIDGGVNDDLASNDTTDGANITDDGEGDTPKATSRAPARLPPQTTLVNSHVGSKPTLDKLFVVAVLGNDSGYRVAVREYDVRTQSWSPVVERRTVILAELGDIAFRSVIDAFAPLAMIVSAEHKTATIRVRGAALPTRDPTLQFVAPGDLFRPVVRHNDRDGAVRAVQTIPWTYLLVDSYDDTDLDCRIVTGLRSPISARRRGRVEQLAIMMRFTPGPTRVVLRSLSEPRVPLVGCTVYAYSPQSTETVL